MSDTILRLDNEDFHKVCPFRTDTVSYQATGVYGQEVHQTVGFPECYKKACPFWIDNDCFRASKG